jgi:host factor-I protein
MATEFDSGIPSIRQIQTFIQDGHEVEIKVTTGDLINGKVRWQDSDCIALMDHYDQSTIIWRHSIVFLKPKAKG